MKSERAENSKNPFYKKELNLLKKREHIIGVDIGSESLKLVEMSGNNIKCAINTRIPDGVIVDGKIEAGVIISDIIKNLIKNNKIKSTNCSLVLSGNEVIIRELKLPLMNENNLYENIESEIASILPLSIEEYCIDYKVLECKKDENDNFVMNVMVAAAPLYLVKEYINILKRAGLKAKYVDVYPSILGKMEKLFLQSSSNEPENTCFVDFGANYTRICLYKKGKYVLHKLIPQGGRVISKLISENVGIEYSSADTLKKEMSLLVSNLKSESFDFIKEYYDDIIAEIESTFYYYKSINNNAGVERIYICGGGSKIKGIKQYMENQLTVDVVPVGSIFKNTIKIDNKIEELDEFTNAIASTLREEWTNV